MCRLLFGLVLITFVIYSNGLINSEDRAAGFKVHFGSLIDLPTNIDDATAAGWVYIERAPSALLPDLVMYCPSDDVTVCVLYMDAGYIAGLQISLPIDAFTNSVPADFSKNGFKKWIPTHGYYSGDEHWFTSQFFISEETLNNLSYNKGAALAATGEILYDGGVWVTEGDGDTLVFIDGTGDVTATRYTKQACIPAMGNHYYYNMSSTTSCDSLYPWFTLVDGEQLIGTGFMIFGDRLTPKSGQVDWFEKPSSLAVKAIVPRGPNCLYDLASSPGVTTLHIYYINDPLSVAC